MIFEPGKSYWTLDQATYDDIIALFGDDGESILADFEYVADTQTWYASWDKMTDEEIAILGDDIILFGKFDYKKSTQSTKPL